MAQEGSRRLTEDQILAIEELLVEYPDSFQRRGAAMVEAGAVRSVRWKRPGKEIVAEVEDGGATRVSVVFDRRLGIDDALCKRCDDYLCPHVVAVCRTLLDDWTDRPIAIAAAEPAASEQVAAVAGSKSADLGSPEVSLADFLRKQTGASLAPRELEVATAIEEFWRQGKATITDQHLLQLVRSTSYFYGWRPEPVVLWPEHRPPRSGAEAFWYIAHALRVREKLPKMRMFSTVDWAAVDRLIAPWLRDQEVLQWRRDLHRLSLTSRDPVVPVAFRLRLDAEGAIVEWRPAHAPSFEPVKIGVLRECVNIVGRGVDDPKFPMDEAARKFLGLFPRLSATSVRYPAGSEDLEDLLKTLLREPGFGNAVATSAGVPITRDPGPLVWGLEAPAVPAAGEDSASPSDYHLVLRRADGTVVPPSLVTLQGWPTLHVLPDSLHVLHDPFVARSGATTRIPVPAGAIESEEGISALRAMKIPVPEAVAARILTLPYRVTVRCRLDRPAGANHDQFQLAATATLDGPRPDEHWNGVNWEPVESERSSTAPAAGPAPDADRILCADRSLLQAARLWLREAAMETWGRAGDGERWNSRRLQGAALRDFPEFFSEWISRRPEGVTIELDPELASLRDGRVAGNVRLDLQQSGVDWFDLRVVLDVSDVELTPEEIELLLKANGRWVRLEEKGWRRLEFSMSDDERTQLADLGLPAGDLVQGEPQRLHVFQLAGAAGGRLLPPERAVEIRRRADELRTTVTPEVPATMTAALRPYQRDGYHFLAYLATNRFGGILADDMGLGKTVQTLAWLAWLKESGRLDGPALVVCPKSVQDNWRAEVARFCPSFRTRVWTHDAAGDLDAATAPAPAKKSARKKAAVPPPVDDLVIINYTQLRLHEETLRARAWSAVVLDEAQYIKNPSSQTARSACALTAGHRLALSGTPIENRLLDLWSIMNFAMPGALGSRAAFNRMFNGKDDPLARRRLAARVRPFVLRRTKNEVAQDLPDRTEEEIGCALDGPQAALYRAELKHARTILLKAKTAAQLDKLRFNILTSLLRLRQICCHPALAGGGEPDDESAKLAALLDLLEPLMEEGHKVLVFSQFVDMLEIIRSEVASRDWPHLVLTGQTEDRGALVSRFQQTEGASVFLISLKAGGFGLNLTAASYVVLFDPWWNPAVENQAIDRTHRIGQTNKVIAYRLIARDTIEEKIRELQKQKSALASDILGEESFAKALTLDDFRFLLGSGDPEPG